MPVLRRLSGLEGAAVRPLSHTSDSFTAILDALAAERDASDIRDRNIRTVRRNVELKGPHGRLPYGYQRV